LKEKKEFSLMLISGRMIYLQKLWLIPLVAAPLGRTTSVSTTAVSKASAAAALFAWLRNAHTQLTIAQALSVEHANGFLRLCLISHFDKSEALGSAAIAIFDHRHRSDSSGLKEEGPQLIFRGRIRQISNI
jgi:hypothetical protein